MRMCGSAWVAVSMCVGFSEYLLENRVPRSADLIRILYEFFLIRSKYHSWSFIIHANEKGLDQSLKRAYNMDHNAPKKVRNSVNWGNVLNVLPELVSSKLI